MNFDISEQIYLNLTSRIFFWVLNRFWTSYEFKDFLHQRIF